MNIGINQFSNITPTQRFWNNVNKTDTCWNWIGCKKIGYGTFRVERKNILAHRYSYQLHNGSIPDGMLVCHRCDNHSCVNPKHLFLGTHKDNTQDMVNKNRNFIAAGELHGMCKLTEEKVRYIRNYPVCRGYRDKLIEKFNISKQTITDIKCGRSWKHII